MKRSGVLAVLVLVLLVALSAVQYYVPRIKADAKTIVYAAVNAGTDAEKWQDVLTRIEDLPSIPPIGMMKKIARDVDELVYSLTKLPPPEQFSLDSPIQYSDVDAYIQWFYRAKSIVNDTENRLSKIPKSILPADERENIEMAEDIFAQVNEWTGDAEELIDMYEQLKAGKDRVLILFQNNNEPRSTGGFTGSVAFLDFTPRDIQFSFWDIYALDRLVPQSAMRPAPQFFEALDTQISLRDANFSPDFATSAEEYQHYFTAIGKRVPTTVVAIDTHVIRSLLSLMNKPIVLDPWGVTITEDNVDMVLSFLVESKIAGRMDVKAPVENLLRQVMDKGQWRDPEVTEDIALEMLKLTEEGHIQAWSEHKNIQKQFRQWGIDGNAKPPKDADDFLQVDLVSIGANKSDRFMDMDVTHDTTVLPDGAIRNTVTIRRTHTLEDGGIERILGMSAWPSELTERLNSDMRFVLGDSQNRTVLRFMVPKDSELISGESPSGVVDIYPSDEMAANIIEVPMFMMPGETLTATAVYETRMDRGSSAWRPYHFVLLPTPARKEASFIKLMTPARGSTSTAESNNINREVPLKRQDFRAVVEF